MKLLGNDFWETIKERKHAKLILQRREKLSLLRDPCAPQGHSGTCAGHLAIREDQFAIDHYITNAHRKLVWLGKGGAVGDCFFVEDHEIGSKTLAHHSSITEAEGLCW